MDEPRRNWISNPSVWVLPCLLAVPVFLATIFTESVPAARELSSNKEISSLAFSQYSVDLGQVPAVGTVPAHFDFKNSGSGNLEILEFIPSCGCLAPKLYPEKRSYAPGEWGRFYVSVKTANETPGPKDYRVVVKYDDGEPQERTVTFKMVIPHRKVTISPSEIYFYQLTGDPDSKKIELTDHRGLPLNVLDIETTSPLVQAEAGQKEIAGNVTTIPIQIDVPGHVPAGKQTALIKIHTDDPEYDVISVPVLIWGPENPIQQTSGTVPVQEPAPSQRVYRPGSQSSEL